MLLFANELSIWPEQPPLLYNLYQTGNLSQSFTFGAAPPYLGKVRAMELRAKPQTGKERAEEPITLLDRSGRERDYYRLPESHLAS